VAKGRFISKGISQSDQVAALSSDRARLMFTWMIPHADVHGQLPAHPLKLKGQVLTMLDVSAAEVEEALQEMERVGLVRLYEVEGTRYLWFPGWSRHQKTNPEREGHPFPGHPWQQDPLEGQAPTLTTNVSEGSSGDGAESQSRSDSGVAQESVQNDSTLSRSRSSTKSTRSKKHGLAAAAPLGVIAAKITDRDLEALMNIYNKHRGALPEARVLTKFRKRQLTALARHHGVEEADRLLVDATTNCAAESFWRDRGYGLDNLLRDDRVIARAESQRNRPRTDFSDHLSSLDAEKGWQ
jgi:hypothetical protein